MSLEECVGQLLCPLDRKYKLEEWKGIIRDVPLGCIFFGPMPSRDLRAAIEVVQAGLRIPVIVSSDLEHGAGFFEGCENFPWLMACGAADDPALMRLMGQATAMEGRSLGIQWTFSPVVDLNYNFNNPVTNIRSFSDDPGRVIRLAKEFIQGMQENGLAATAKHFPGDGMDDRDQHRCTTVNSMKMKDWRATYGRVWKGMIDCGVMSIMSGHIALPDYEGLSDTASIAMPATLNPKLQIDLLRNELGFEGVIVSDALPMSGLTMRIRDTEAALAFIEAGGDVVLFANPYEDFRRILNAVRAGRLSEARLRESTRRVLVMKALVGLHRGYAGFLELSEKEKAKFQAASRDIAEKSIYIQRSSKALTVPPKPGTKILTVTLRWDKAPPAHLTDKLETVDQELKRRGFQVDHFENPSHSKLNEAAEKYECIYVNFVILPGSLSGTIRLVGWDVFNEFTWRAFYLGRDNTVFTSFGSPYVLYDKPHLPNMVLAYGAVPATQQAAVKVWLGEIQAQGKCPVTMPKF